MLILEHIGNYRFVILCWSLNKTETKNSFRNLKEKHTHIMPISQNNRLTESKKKTVDLQSHLDDCHCTYIHFYIMDFPDGILIAIKIESENLN